MKEDTRFSCTARRPGGMLVPRPAARILSVTAAHHRAVQAAKTTARVSVALALLALLFVHVQPAMGLQPPNVPPSEEICGSPILNQGPSSPPGGAVTVPAGDDSGSLPTSPDTVYWFAPGTHTLGTGPFSQILAGQGSTYIGAPGAIINGQGLNQYAFGGTNSNVTIEYLTIQDFIPGGGTSAINYNGEPDWTIEYNTVQDNVPGAGLGLGTNSVVSGNCLTENGEYGFNGYSVNDVSSLTGGPSDITMTGNEISYNNTCNWEVIPGFPITPPAGCAGAGEPGCGCSGAGKFWEVNGATIADNYVHDNYSAGLWADTNDIGFAFTGNYISNNLNEGIIYEISYNALIQGNIFVRNAITQGVLSEDFPASAIYLSESGSDSRVPGPYGAAFQVTNNQFYDNWGGVVLWENSNRYCSSVANTSTGKCTLVNTSVANLQTCSSSTLTPVPPSRDVSAPAPRSRKGTGRGGTSQGQNFLWLINTTPYINDCRWKTQNVQVTGNLFAFSKQDLGVNCTTAQYCGFNGIFSVYGSIAPFVGTAVENNITFSQGNEFAGNTYCGPWQFDALSQGNVSTFAQWQGAPYDQDAGSTLDSTSASAACNPPVPFMMWRNPVNRTVIIPIRAGR